MATKRQYNRNNQSTASVCSSSGTAMNSVSSATPTSSNQSSRSCSCAIGACGHSTPTTNTLTNTSSSNMMAGAADSQTPQMMAGGGTRTQSRNSTMSLASGATANNQIDNKSANNDQSSSASANIGQCRICRKTIEPSEPCHLCSNCNQFICDDCASYSASDQFWMCSSCRRRALNPAIPAEALKELGLNQNSSAVRRMTLRLSQNELTMAVNKCSSESPTSSTAAWGAQTASRSQESQHRGQALPAHQQLLLRRQSSARRTTSDGDSSEVASQARRVPPSLNRQNSLGPQLISTGGAGSSRLAQPSLQAKLPTSQSAAKPKQQNQRPLKPFQSAAYAGGAGATPRDVKQQHSQVVSNKPRAAEPSSNGSSQLMRSSSRQRCKTGGGEPLKRVNSVQQHRSGAQKTLSQPAVATTSTPSQQHRAAGVKGKWQEPDAKRVPSLSHSQRQGSLNLQLDQRIEQSISSMVTPQEAAQALTQQWQQSQLAASACTTGSGAYMSGAPAAAAAYANNEPHFEQGHAQKTPAPDNQQQLVRAIMHNHRKSLAFSSSPIQQQQQMFNVAAANPMQLSSAQGGSGRASTSQPYMSQLIPIPPEQMHLRRLSDQSNLVRRSSIIASNIFDGMTIARNRSHSNIDSVHYMHQQMGSRQQLDEQTAAFVAASGAGPWQLGTPLRQPTSEPSGTQLDVGAYEIGSSSATNLHYLAPGQQQQEQLQQRRLSDGGQYFAPEQQQQQQISSIVTSYALKQQSRRRHYQSSEEVHSDSSSDLDQGPSMRAAGGDGGYTPATMDYQDDAYASQQPITIPSVSVSEFAAAAARRRSSIHMQQQQLCDDQLMATYQQDNQITPMQINVAIEQVIQQQQLEQLAPSGHQDAQFIYMMRRGSSGRVLPCIPGGQSRSLLDLPLNGSNQTNEQSRDTSADQSGANLSNGHTRNASTAGLNQSTLGLPCLSPTVRRASAPEGQIIKIVVDDIDSSLPFTGRHTQNGMKQFDQQLQAGNFYERHILCRDDSLDPNGNHVGRGFGLQVMGGKLDQDGKLQACVKWVLQGGPANKVGIRPGDKLIEWDGKCLVDMSYEQVAEIIESSANIAEILVKPKPQRLFDPHQPPANYVRSQRRMSQQTERDLRRHSQTTSAASGGGQSSQQQRRMSCAVQPAAGAASEMGRLGTGRRLPQIPPAHIDTNSSQLGVGVGVSVDMPMPIRHASTGQLDQALTAQNSNDPFGSQSGAAGAFMGQSGHHLGPYHLGTEPHQQSRSASELHRDSFAGLNYVQNQANFTKSNESNVNSMSTLAAGVWMPPQQYGGSQQMMPGSWSYATNECQSHTFNGRDELGGLIGLQVSVDERLATLEISVLSAHNIERDPSLEYVVKVRILPDNNRFKVCTTQPSSDMNWKETFIFQNFPIHQVQRMALEIGIWVFDEAPRLSAQMAQPKCEALIPIQSARERNIDFWSLRPPPTSPQTRRKSLNDLIGNHYCQSNSEQSHRTLASYKPTAHNNPGQETMPLSAVKSTGNDKKVGSYGSLFRVSSIGPSDSPPKMIRHRERSSSIRNSPDKSPVQPRRASDEVATSSSQRLIARLSPAVSRRSISVMNVGDGYGGGRASRSPVSRLGSQANILKAIQMRRDSNQIPQQRDHSGNGSPIKYGN